MATGIVKYTATLRRTYMHPSYHVFYNTAGRYSKQYQLESKTSFAVSQNGTFPSGKYTISNVDISLSIGADYGNDFTVLVSAETAKGEVQLGSVQYSGGSYSTPGKLKKNALSKNVSYSGITKIILTINSPGYSFHVIPGNFSLSITYQEDQPVAIAPKVYDPVVVTGVKESKGIQGEARNTSVRVSIEGIDISNEVNEHLLSMTYTDNEEDATDDLQISMHDKDGKWLQKWLNDTIQAAAYGRFQRTTSNVRSGIINDNASYYGSLTVRYSYYAYSYWDPRYRTNPRYAWYYYGGLTYKLGNSSGREFDIINLSRYMKLLGYYKGDVTSQITEDLADATAKAMEGLGVSYSGYMYNNHWKALIAAVNGKVDDIYTITYTAQRELVMYSEAKTSSQKITTIKRGADIEILQRASSSWFKVEFEGVEGYVYSYSTSYTAFKSVTKAAPTPPKISTKGLSIKCGIVMRTPDGKEQTLNFGEFTLDTVTASGPPSSVVLKATALPYANGVRTEERDKAWCSYSLSRIGQEIAKKAGLGFLFDSGNDRNYTRVEQVKQTDISFLMELCHRNGCSLKVTDNKIVIFDQSRYEKMKQISTIGFMDGSYLSYNLLTQEGENHYDGCVVRYYNAKLQKVFTGTAKSDDYDESNKESNFLIITNEAVESNAEAKSLAEARLRMSNKFEKRASFVMLGNPQLGAGLTLALDGFGLWDEKYIIKQARHTVDSSGYTTQVQLRGIPNKESATGTLASVTKSLAERIVVPFEVTYATGSVWKTTSSAGLYQTKDLTGYVATIPSGTPVTILGKEGSKGVKVSVELSSWMYSYYYGYYQGKKKTYIGYITSSEIERATKVG